MTTAASLAHLGGTLRQTFLVASGELGMCSAAWLFVRTVAGEGDGYVEALGDELGREFPVLHAVVGEWLSGHRDPPLDVARACAALDGVRRLVVVGVEAQLLDALVSHLARDVEVALLDYSVLDMDVARVLSNWGGRLTLVSLASFQRQAGARSALLTFAYGHDDHSTHVRPAWLRVVGPDVRVQFRALVAWNVLRAPMALYPRWLVEVPSATFSAVV